MYWLTSSSDGINEMIRPGGTFALAGGESADSVARTTAHVAAVRATRERFASTSAEPPQMRTRRS
jgi:hypothetical protein